MMRTLLLRGMVAGLLAGGLAAVFAFFVGEPPIDGAIAVEERTTQESHGHEHDHGATSDAHSHGHGEDAAVSRDVQSTVGLFAATAGYGVAIGGLFAVAFALIQGRVSSLPPRTSAALLAAGGFGAVVLVPFVKYPANPPAVGSPGTIDDRTSVYFGLVAFSLALAIVAVVLGRMLADRLGAWFGGLLSTGGYLVAVTVTAALFPAIDEVPGDFPASLLWEFRVASVGIQLVLWATLALTFGGLAERALGTTRPTSDDDTPAPTGQR
ncbi:CbtA family protein [Saccharomonospora saliphila]|uniref:CbtA family protein n=1 Tax=Saccharomonospora saliphila TaxID=369829 RepID=UPI00039A9D7B|nr:CbtA family protein [Saccharomonospora saliphila]